MKSRLDRASFCAVAGIIRWRRTGGVSTGREVSPLQLQQQVVRPSTFRRSRAAHGRGRGWGMAPSVMKLGNNEESRSEAEEGIENEGEGFISVEVPKSFEDMQRQATENGIAGLRAGEKLIEINFPSVPNIATAALNQLLDSNRAYVRTFVQACRVRIPSFSQYYLVFPDEGEARLARKSYGNEVENVCTFSSSGETIGEGGENGVIVVVQPGFNVDEYINMEELGQFNMPMVSVNGDLDKIRSKNYYPKWFYPGLHRARTRFLLGFVEVYYIKFLSNFGTLLKTQGRPWTLLYRTGVIWQGAQRPEFRAVEKVLAKAREDELLSS